MPPGWNSSVYRSGASGLMLLLPVAVCDQRHTVPVSIVSPAAARGGGGALTVPGNKGGLSVAHATRAATAGIVTNRSRRIDIPFNSILSFAIVGYRSSSPPAAHRPRDANDRYRGPDGGADLGPGQRRRQKVGIAQRIRERSRRHRHDLVLARVARQACAILAQRHDGRIAPGTRRRQLRNLQIDD